MGLLLFFLLILWAIFTRIIFKSSIWLLVYVFTHWELIFWGWKSKPTYFGPKGVHSCYLFIGPLLSKLHVSFLRVKNWFSGWWLDFLCLALICSNWVLGQHILCSHSDGVTWFLFGEMLFDLTSRAPHMNDRK